MIKTLLVAESGNVANIICRTFFRPGATKKQQQQVTADMNGVTHNAKMVVVDDSGNLTEYQDIDDLDYQITSEFTNPSSFAIVSAGDAFLSSETIDGLMSSISIFPNPTSSILNVNHDGELNISMYNISGKLILETNDKQINLSKYRSGTYILHVQNLKSGNSTNFKIIKE